MTNTFRDIVIEDIAKFLFGFRKDIEIYYDEVNILEGQIERWNITKEVEAKIKEFEKQ